ncbi:MAG: ADP-ribosylglycohydrolase family protein [Gemmatimonadetes bacterium]|nr:ADP-ribosylglycohydrolase family protein [Gemmatimonadota bacterium]
MRPAPAMTLPTLDQTLGSLLGLALGDALGAVVEAQPPAEARRYVDEVLQSGLAGTRGRGRYPFGQVTDDTQLAHALLQSIVDQRGFDPAHFAERFAELVLGGGLVGGGPASRAAARALAEGTPWHAAGMPAPYAGNGAAMRAGPLGVLFGHDFQRLAQVSADQARVTHHDSRSGAGALAIAGAAAIAARRERVDPEAVLVELSRLVEPLDASVATTLWEMEGWVGLEPDQAAGYLHEHGIEPEGRDRWHGISSFVTSSVCWSLYAFLQEPDSWWEATCLAIGVGGDTDTLAAMTGSIVGARVGAGQLPEALVERLHDGTRWGAADLRALGEAAHRVTLA